MDTQETHREASSPPRDQPPPTTIRDRTGRSRLLLAAAAVVAGLSVAVVLLARAVDQAQEAAERTA